MQCSAEMSNLKKDIKIFYKCMHVIINNIWSYFQVILSQSQDKALRRIGELREVSVSACLVPSFHLLSDSVSASSVPNVCFNGYHSNFGSTKLVQRAIAGSMAVN